MKANELMIGDHVSHFDEKKNCVVTELRGRKVAVSYTDDNGNTKYSELLPEMAFEPIPLTAEILEKNGFIKDAFTNVSPDYYYGDDEHSICINLNSTCDKSKSVWIEKRSSRFAVSIEESRNSLDKKPLYVHQLQHALRLCNIDKNIEL